MKLMPIINDMMVIFFDLLIFTKMVKLKQDGFFYKAAMYLGCACIIMAYFFSTYIFHFPAALSSALTMSIPSFLLFFWLSEYRDSRFLMTFCFVDSVSLIIAFLGRYAGILTGSVGEIISFIVILLLFSVIVFCGWKSFQKYHALLAVTKKGWNSMAVSTLLIYIGLLFFAAYPKPLVERIEYGPVYLLFSVIVLSFYVVFISSILKTKQIYEQNLKLEKENEIYQIAYTDALTGLGNRAAYIEHINEIDRSKSSHALYCCVILDVNQFKSINDSHGHHTGDDALKGISAALQKIFSKNEALLFRTGGDEFAIIIHNLSEAAVQEKLKAAKNEIEKAGQILHILLSVAIGYSFLAADGKDTVENAFIRADQKMYHAKKHTIS